MESPKTQPIYFQNVVNEIFTEQRSDKPGGKWEDLEQFWGEEKHRLQDIDGQVLPLSSSLEEHLLYDDFLIEPKSKINLKDDDLSPLELITVNGEDIKDIPSTYVIGGFRPNELVVIGTYVDKDIIPGFRYKVRKNLSEEYLFDGKGKYLESIGLGYGKRLTFEGDTLNENENYFWSDSRIHGYGFISQAIRNEDIFTILDTKTGQRIGRVLINNPAIKDDVVTSTTVGERGYVEKEIEVHFTCDVILTDSINKQNIFIEDVPVRGRAAVVRESMSSHAKIDQIFVDEFALDGCLFLPEE